MRLLIELQQVQAAKHGDRVALENVLETVWPHAFRIAKSILRDQDAAEDAAQEACATVTRTIAALRSPESFNAWFYRLVVRQAMSDLRKRQPPVQSGDSSIDPTENEAQSMDVRAALYSLPLAQRTALILFHYVGLSSREIGVVTGVPAPTVRFRLSQARRSMRKLLDDRDYSSHRTSEVLL